MFKEVIRINNKSLIRMGQTKIPFHQTFGEILVLLSKHECDQVLTSRNGDKHQIAFVYQSVPYLMTIPRVFVQNKYNDMIGIRMVYYYLRIMLDWAKERVVDLPQIMLASRLIEV